MINTDTATLPTEKISLKKCWIFDSNLSHEYTTYSSLVSTFFFLFLSHIWHSYLFCWVKNSCITNSFVSKIEKSFKSIVLKKEKKQALYSPIPIFTTGVPNNDQKKYEIKRTITNRFYFYCPIQIIKTYIQKIALDVVYEFKRSYSVQISKLHSHINTLLRFQFY